MFLHISQDTPKKTGIAHDSHFLTVHKFLVMELVYSCDYICSHLETDADTK